MLKRVFWVIGLLAILLVVIALFLPAHYQIERSVQVNRPASVVFGLLNSYRSFEEWSPWAARDPSATYNITGPKSGTGARLSWSGDSKLVGSGWQEIVGSQPYTRIDINMDFDGEGTASSYFVLDESANGTQLTWGFVTDVTEGRSTLDSFMGKYFGLFLNKWIGADYEQGLVAFKIFAESFPEADFSIADIGIVTVEPVDVLMVASQTSQQADDVAQALAKAYGEIVSFMSAEGIQLNGQPMSITRSWDENGYQFDAALPVDRLPEQTTGAVRTGQSPSGRAVRLVHTGPYDTMLESYERLASYMATHGLEAGAVSWEHYISDPGTTAPEDRITHIYYLLAED